MSHHVKLSCVLVCPVFLKKCARNLWNLNETCQRGKEKNVWLFSLRTLLSFRVPWKVCRRPSPLMRCGHPAAFPVNTALVAGPRVNPSLSPAHQCRARGWIGRKYRYFSRRCDSTGIRTQRRSFSGARYQFWKSILPPFTTYFFGFHVFCFRAVIA